MQSLKQYQSLMDIDNIKLSFDKKAVERIARV